MRRADTTRPLARWAVLWGVALFALASCEGPNQFSGQLPTQEGEDTEAPVVTILVPEGEDVPTKLVGEPLEVRARVQDEFGVTNVTIRAIERRGDPEFGTDREVDRFEPQSVSLDQARDTVIERTLVPTGETQRDTAVILVEATDEAGNSSTDSVKVFLGGPQLVVFEPGDGETVAVGQPLLLSLRADDPAGVTNVGFSLTGPEVDTLIELDLSPPDEVVEFDTEFVVPENASDTIEVVARVTSSTGLARSVGPISAVVVKPPSVEIVVPRTDSVSATPLGDSLEVHARVRDDDGVATVVFTGIERRGDPDFGTDEIVDRFETRTVTLDAARDTVVKRFLQPTADERRDTAIVFVEAFDVAGNSSMDSVRVILGGPSVTLFDLQDGDAAPVGQVLSLALRAVDPTGIVNVAFSLSGTGVDTVIEKSFSPGRDNVDFDAEFTVPEDASGTIEVVARAVNAQGLPGVDGPVSLSVVEGDPDDEISPTVSISMDAAPRLELTDSIDVLVSGSDDRQGSGLVAVGYTLMATSESRGDTVVSDRVEFDAPRGGTVNRTFRVPIVRVDSLALPDSVRYEVWGFAVDAQGNCAAAVSGGGDSFECAIEPVTGSPVAANRAGLVDGFQVVAGRTIGLPAGGDILDAAVDTLRRNLFLSNVQLNQVEVFRLDDEIFGQAIGVGSEPWGMGLVQDFTAPDPDSLLVANSGGTNIEVVDIQNERASPDDRFFYPDVVVFDVELNQEDLTFEVRVTPDIGTLAFSDRPQFIASDTFGNRIFSTRTVDELSEVGTVRKSFFEDGWEQTETKLFVEHAVFSPIEDNYAFAHVDSIGTSLETVNIGGEDVNVPVLTVFDHVPGFPDNAIIGTARLSQGETPATAWAELRVQDSDAFMVEGGAWQIPSLGFQDTTFVSASGDGTFVAIGEGDLDREARVLMYQAARADTTALTGTVPVADLITQRGGSVRGVGLNYDGTLGVVRGDGEVAFFDSNLQSAGRVDLRRPGGAGAALHPLHADQKTFQHQGGTHHPDTHVAFIGTGGGTIDIVDTFRFLRIGRITIRDVITGPLRAVLPFPGDNDGLRCETLPATDRRGFQIGRSVRIYQGEDFVQPMPDDGPSEDRCIVVKLFGVTDAGGVVVVDVRKSDILRFHPNRQ